MALLEVEKLSMRFGGVVAVDGVSFELDAGEVIGVIGPNGAGKSTLLGALAGAPQPSEGAIRLKGRDITRAKPHVRCHLGISRTYQVPRPFGDLSVRRNVEIASLFGGDGPVDVSSLLAEFGLNGRADEKAAELTHSEQRRLELARAVSTSPEILLLDEMGAGLTPEELDEFAALIKRISGEGIAVTVVEHIMSLVMAVSDHILVLDAGRLIAEGKPDEISQDPQVIAAYFGER